MKGWTKDGERVDLLPWQDEEVRAYLEWSWNPEAPIGSRFMYSEQALADEQCVFQSTIGKINKAEEIFRKLEKLWELGFKNTAEAIEIYLEAQREYGNQE